MVIVLKPWKFKLITQIDTYDRNNLLVLHMKNGTKISHTLDKFEFDKTTDILIIRKDISKTFVVLDNILFWEIIQPRG